MNLTQVNWWIQQNIWIQRYKTKIFIFKHTCGEGMSDNIARVLPPTTPCQAAQRSEKVRIGSACLSLDNIILAIIDQKCKYEWIFKEITHETKIQLMITRILLVLICMKVFLGVSNNDNDNTDNTTANNNYTFCNGSLSRDSSNPYNTEKMKNN